MPDETEQSDWASSTASSEHGTNKDGFAALAILVVTAVLVIAAINAFV